MDRQIYTINSVGTRIDWSCIESFRHSYVHMDKLMMLKFEFSLYFSLLFLSTILFGFRLPSCIVKRSKSCDFIKQCCSFNS
jgi:hypothetical protein